MADKWTVELSDDELQAVIDFNLSMADDAIDSCEYLEANERKIRAAKLRKIQLTAPVR